jgi:hypothetical protein
MLAVTALLAAVNRRGRMAPWLLVAFGPAFAAVMTMT